VLLRIRVDFINEWNLLLISNGELDCCRTAFRLFAKGIAGALLILVEGVNKGIGTNMIDHLSLFFGKEGENLK
jgi:hypothetical protein